MIPEAAYTVLFYGIGAAAVVLALAVVTSRRLLRAAIYLMGVLMASAGLYLMLGAEFLAGIQVLVYVGGIVVLIVFAIMLTRSAELQVDNPSPLRKILGVIAAAGFLVLIVMAFRGTEFPLRRGGPAPLNEPAAIGRQLLDFGPEGYVLPFEVVSVLLLAAVIGGIVVARKTPPRGQPFTSGGDLPGEAEFHPPRTQRERDSAGGGS
jgi:NADH-quinone oxidoreductase subunit J